MKKNRMKRVKLWLGGVLPMAVFVTLNSMVLPVLASGNVPGNPVAESGIVLSDTAEEEETTEEDFEEGSEEEESEEESEETNSEDTDDREDAEDESETEADDDVEEDIEEDSEEILIEDVEEEDLSAGKDTVWNEKVSLTKNETVNGNLTVNADVYLNGYTLTVKGNLTATRDIVIGDNGKLVVTGNYTQETYNLNMYYWGATVDVGGDFRLCKVDSSGNIIKGSGGLYRDFWSEATCKDDSVINIGGDLIINTTEYSPNRGTINLKGDLITKSDAVFCRWDIGSLGYGVTINYVGDSQQLIDITQGTFLDMCGGTNKDIKVKKYFSGKLINNFTITADQETVTVNGRGLNADGYILTINGSVLMDSEKTSYLGENGKIEVNGDYTQKEGTLYLENGGIVDVSGNLNIYGLDKNGNIVKGNGGFYMDSYNTDSVINAGGNFVFNSRGYCPGDATFNVGGNFTDSVGKSWEVVNLIGNASESNKQIVTIAENGIINSLSLKSCGDFYVIPKGCYNSLKKPKHKYDNGKVSKATTKTTQGEKTFTCTVCGHTYVKKIPRVQDIFSDISGKEWYVDAVQYAYENDMMAGTGSEFKPGANLSREQLTQVLYSTEGKPKVTVKNPFSDVADGAWYAKSVLWAKQKGIADGKSDGTFGVGNPIKRQDLAMMLYKYAMLKGYKLNKDDSAIEGYKDTDKVSTYAKDAMNWAITNGIISGKGEKGASKAETRLDPGGKASRAECAAMLKKLIENNK